MFEFFSIFGKRENLIFKPTVPIDEVLLIETEPDLEMVSKKKKRAERKANANVEKSASEEKEEEVNNSDEGEEKKMEHDHGHERKGYICFDPLPMARIDDVYTFQDCCCQDDGVRQQLYDFILNLKGNNPFLKRIEVKFTPNQACSALVVRWLFDAGAGGVIPQVAETDRKAILAFYLQLLFGP